MRGYAGGIWHKSAISTGITVSVVTQAQGRGIEGSAVHINHIWIRVLS